MTQTILQRTNSIDLNHQGNAFRCLLKEAINDVPPGKLFERVRLDIPKAYTFGRGELYDILYQ